MGAMRELIEDGKTGYVIPVKRDESGEPVMEYNVWGFPKPVFDEQKVLDALHNIESLDLEYVAKYVREKFSIKKMGEGYLRVYERVLNGERW
jgi:glycosyltransferase involved in cell wall biosynthesis